MDPHDLLPVENEEKRSLQPPGPPPPVRVQDIILEEEGYTSTENLQKHKESTPPQCSEPIERMDVHDMLPVYKRNAHEASLASARTEEGMENPSGSHQPQHQRHGHEIETQRINYPLRQLKWVNLRRLSDCVSFGDKFVYILTCCNYRYQPGCDTEGFCFWCGDDYSYLSNGWCSCLSPSICCCCPCCLWSVAGCCDETQQCCRGIEKPKSNYN